MSTKSSKPDLSKIKSDAAKFHGSSFAKEFREFINRGSVVDLAIGVVVGGAFSSIVTSLVNDIVMPVVGLVVGGVDFTNLEITIPNFLGTTDAAHIKYGNFIQNLVNFLIIAFVLFLMVRAINKMNEKRDAALAKLEIAEKKAEDDEKAAEKQSEDEQLALLRDIRNSLVKDTKSPKPSKSPKK